jgi:hypothetical protein
MNGRSVNIYFQENLYSQLRQLTGERRISRFVNEAVKEKLHREQKQQKAELKQKLIAGYQARAKNQKIRKMIQTYGKMSWEDISTELSQREEKKDAKKKQ